VTHPARHRDHGRETLTPGGPENGVGSIDAEALIATGRRDDNTASDVWADTAHRSQAIEKWLKAQGRVSCINRKKPRGKPMPDHVRRGNAKRLKTSARVEHVFAQQKATMGYSSAPSV